MKKKIWVAVAIACVAIVVILVTFHFGQKNEWEAVVADLRSRGMPVTLKDLETPSVADEENFAAHPLLKQAMNNVQDPLFSHTPGPTSGYLSGTKLSLENWWKKNNNQLSPDFLARVNAASPADHPRLYLETLEPHEEIIATLYEFSNRPYARFPMQYAQGYGMLLPHLGPSRGLVRVTSSKATAHLQLGQMDPAFKAAVLSLRLSNLTRSESVLISELVRIACFHLAMGPVWQGLNDRQWTREQLVQLQKELQQFDFLAGYHRAMQGERAFSFDAINETSKNFGFALSPVNRFEKLAFLLLPESWYVRQKIKLSKIYDEMLLPVISTNEHRWRSDYVQKLQARLNTPSKLTLMKEPFVRMLIPALQKTSERSAVAQFYLDAAQVAIALELYRLDQGTYPDSLDQLQSQYLREIPPDVTTGRPLKYRRMAESYLLYGHGFNEKDDDGLAAFNNRKNTSNNWESGDWVWWTPAAGKLNALDEAAPEQPD